MTEPNWGPSGEDVYRRTYSRPKPDGSRETWPETVARVVAGNASLVPGVDGVEKEDLARLIGDFSILPAGRHLWASGVKGRQFLFNCWVAPWGDAISDHFRFVFLRLMEGGGVGSNYSSRYTQRYGPPVRLPEVHIVCDDSHQDYAEMRSQGLLSSAYSSDYCGAYLEIEDSREGWAEALADLLGAAWSDDGSRVRVYDVSRVRPAGARLKTFGGYASGPGPLAKMLLGVRRVLSGLFMAELDEGEWTGIPLDPLSAMEIDHEVATCVVSGGVRRSARMSILPWDDPWVFEFIRAKTGTESHWTTNMSVAVDDDFLRLVNAEEDTRPARTAKKVLALTVEGMLANGEPGLWNHSLSQQGEVSEVVATNPCGEIALMEREACNLGHLNLERFVSADGSFRYNDAVEAARLITRFLVRATFGDVADPGSRNIMDRNRRIGVGLFGMQAAFAKMGIRYTDAPSNSDCWDILEGLRYVVRKEAREYAFQVRIPEPVKVTTVAPTGTIAKLPGTSEGIHWIYAKYFLRRIRFSTVDPGQLAQLAEYEAKGYEIEDCLYAPNTKVVIIPTKERLVDEIELRGHPVEIVESADEVSLSDMLDVQAMVQTAWADNAVSFTANVPMGRYTAAEVAELIRTYLPVLKGTTIMPDGARPQAPYERISREQYEAATAKAVADSIDDDCARGACPIR